MDNIIDNIVNQIIQLLSNPIEYRRCYLEEVRLVGESVITNHLQVSIFNRLVDNAHIDFNIETNNVIEYMSHIMCIECEYTKLCRLKILKFCLEANIACCIMFYPNVDGIDRYIILKNIPSFFEAITFNIGSAVTTMTVDNIIRPTHISLNIGVTSTNRIICVTNTDVTHLNIIGKLNFDIRTILPNLKTLTCDVKGTKIIFGSKIIINSILSKIN